MSSFTAARCRHIKVNGTQCGSPALRSRVPGVGNGSSVMNEALDESARNPTRATTVESHPSKNEGRGARHSSALVSINMRSLGCDTACTRPLQKSQGAGHPVSFRGKFWPTGLYPASPRAASPTHPHSFFGCLELLQAPASFLLPRHQTCLASSTCEPVPNARTIGRDVSLRFRGRWRTLLHCAFHPAVRGRINGSATDWPCRALSSARLRLRPCD